MATKIEKILIIQHAFIGDVILATSIIEKLHQFFPDTEIDFQLRKGNEGLLLQHPLLNNVIIWDKSKGKFKTLIAILKNVRKKKYDYVINLHRFGSSGFITAFSGAKYKIGFDKNPFSFLFTKKIKHEIGNGKHETERNHLLIENITDKVAAKPKLYPSANDYEIIKPYTQTKYYCIAPASVWFTKQWPKEKWLELINTISADKNIFLLGAPSDVQLCNEILVMTGNKNNVINLAGKLSLLQTAALMSKSEMNFVNDSAPMHIASAMNAPVKAIFCSTVPSFGFGPLSDNSKVVETTEKLNCRPCGLHGHKKCPQGDFKCAHSITIHAVLS